ncbi:multidrug resistance efflux pump [Bernardetia litoralis DSM 6794]|uniref:Multidrug resistance efflux pump n=1 Tax=Bernardetia litoralis (strain ATCC 23117 / DSM 6794 / NBRC 15988 / NCIMB 1366 / Fx l1 / Sio-4) TaxID=880071 RepID=I4AG49_BERLS|nr:efflux RND transporter periplasmic adaptor subunit [Bernardetia litoralis]AFM02934.1 multidrug resistance efflux pump [Bernardetia litoralis DSM 6794]
MSNKKLFIIIGAVILLVILGVAGKKLGWFGAKDGVEVEFAAVKQTQIVERVSASGKIYPEVEVKLSPDVSGEITELLVKEGDSVKEGQLLLKIRPDTYQTAVDRTRASLGSQGANIEQANARLQQAKAQYFKAKADFGRQQKLYDDKIISLQDFQAAEATFKVAESELQAAEKTVESARYSLQSARATLEEAQANLSLTTIFAPQSGIISSLNVEQGERVVGTVQMTGTELLRIAEFKNMEVRVNVNENDIIRIEMNDTAYVEVDAYPDQNFIGIVTYISRSANNLQTVTADAVTEFEVKIRMNRESYKDLLEKRNFPFLPGMTASVEIITNRKNNALAVPLAAVTVRSSKDNNEKNKTEKDAPRGTPKKETTENSKTEEDKMKEVVFVRDGENQVKMIEVKTGISDFDNIEILSGVEEGSEVVVAPYNAISKTLKDESTVKIAKDKKAK